MAAPWDNPNKKKIDRDFVACTEKYEREYEIHKFNDYSKQKIKHAIKKCCEEVPAPHPREAFDKCMKKHLQS